MKDMIRRWLGLDVIEAAAIQNQMKLDDLSLRLQGMRTDIRTYVHGVGRIISKLDPIYRVPEDDPQRKAESDRIGDEVVRKLRAEAQALDRP